MLTELTIRKAKPTDQNQKLFDGGGLYLEVPPKSNKQFSFRRMQLMFPITDMANNAGSDSSTKMESLSALSGQSEVKPSGSFLSVEQISENGINLVRVMVEPQAPAPNTSDWERVISMTEAE